MDVLCKTTRAGTCPFGTRNALRLDPNNDKLPCNTTSPAKNALFRNSTHYFAANLPLRQSGQRSIQLT